MSAPGNGSLIGAGAFADLEAACAERGFRVSIRPLGEDPLHLSASFSVFGDIAVAASQTSPVTVCRSRDDVRDDAREFFVLPLHFGGAYTLNQAGREHCFETGGTRLVAGNSPYRLEQRPGELAQSFAGFGRHQASRKTVPA